MGEVKSYMQHKIESIKEVSDYLATMRTLTKESSHKLVPKVLLVGTLLKTMHQSSLTIDNQDPESVNRDESAIDFEKYLYPGVSVMRV